MTTAQHSTPGRTQCSPAAAGAPAALFGEGAGARKALSSPCPRQNCCSWARERIDRGPLWASGQATHQMQQRRSEQLAVETGGPPKREAMLRKLQTAHARQQQNMQARQCQHAENAVPACIARPPPSPDHVLLGGAALKSQGAGASKKRQLSTAPGAETCTQA